LNAGVGVGVDVERDGFFCRSRRQGEEKPHQNPTRNNTNRHSTPTPTMLRTMAASLARACSSSGSGRSALLLPSSSCAAAATIAPLLREPRRRLVRAFGLGSHTSDDDPAVLEREKRRNLSGETAKEGECAVPGAVPGVPGWNPRLASDSEAAVRADHAETVSVEEMVELSVRQVTRVTTEETHEEGKESGKDKE
jgi:hypothetical protein